MSKAATFPFRRRCSRKRMAPETRIVRYLDLCDWNANDTNLWEKAQHILLQRRPHHDPVSAAAAATTLNEFQKKHALCLCLGNFLAVQWQQLCPIKWGIEQAASVCKQTSNWQYYGDVYKGSFADEPDIRHWVQKSRWPARVRSFEGERMDLIRFVKHFLEKKWSVEQFCTGLHAFQSVQYYMQDLSLHQYAVSWVGRQLFPADEPLHQVLDNEYDLYWDAVMVSARVLKCIFKQETIVVEQEEEEEQMESHDEFKIQQGKKYLQRMNVHELDIQSSKGLECVHEMYRDTHR